MNASHSFWVVLQGDYEETLLYEVQAESAGHAEQRIRERYSDRDYAIAALFDAAPLRGGFDPFDRS